MKKLFVVAISMALTAVLFSSCASSKKDCQGVRHYKQKGGFYM